MTRKFDSDYQVASTTEILTSENAFRKDVDIRIDSLENGQGVIDVAAAEARDRVVKYTEDVIAPQAAKLQSLLIEFEASRDAIRADAASIVRGGVEARGDTLAKILAVTDVLAPLSSPPLTGTPTAPTAPVGTDTEQIATTAFAVAETAAAVAAFSEDVTTALTARLRLDAPQTLSPTQQSQALANLGVSFAAHFSKADVASVVFTRTGNAALSLKAGTEVSVAGIILRFLVATPVIMPALTPGTDYAIHVCADGSVRADANFSVPTGYTAATSRRIGGFHYAPGSVAAARAGGDTVPQINPHSLWDLAWRPVCPDPRGMTLVAGRFWADIYLTGTDVDANGSSRYGVTIADGSAPPKVPATFGGDGSTTYGSFNWWQANEVLASVGKDPLSYGDFAVAAYGASEGVARGNDPVTTGFATTNAGAANADQKFTSKWGLVQAAGCIWVWGRDFSYRTGANGEGWKDQTGGRGQIYLMNDTGLVAALLGGDWPGGALCGSRASNWLNAPWYSGAGVAARGRCDHLSHV